MYTKLMLLAGILLPMLSHAQLKPSFEGEWYRGLIIHAEGDTLDGFLDYQSSRGEVRFCNDRLIRVFYTAQLKSFQYYDEALKMQRYFANYKVYAQHPRAVKLFEQLIWGKYHIVRKVSHDSSLIGTNGNHTEYQNLNAFFLWDGRKMIRIKNFTKQFEALFAQNKIDLRKLLKEKTGPPTKYPI